MTESLVGERRRASVPARAPRSPLPFRSGMAVVWLSVIDAVAAGRHIVLAGRGRGWRTFYGWRSRHAAIVVQVCMTISTTVTVINLVFGLLIAWVLVACERLRQ